MKKQWNVFSKLAVLALALMITRPSFADPAFTSITSSDFEDISKDMAANFTHFSMMGASKMGSIFGVQLGVVAGQTSVGRTNDIVKRNSGSDLPNLYNAGLLGAIGIPFGVSFEAVLMPKITASGASVSSTSLAAKWNINDVVPVLPINLALRGVYSSASLKFDQTVSSVTNGIEDKTTVTGLQLLLSPSLPVIEPYVGFGVLSGKNEMNISGSTTVFDSTFSTSQSESKTVSGTQLIAGVELSLPLFRMGFEYNQLFGTSRYGFKLGLGF